MKEVFALLLALCAAFSFAGCSGAAQSLDLDASRAAVSELGILGMAYEPGAEELLSIYGIDAELIEKGILLLPGAIVQSSACIVVLPKEGQDDAVKQQLDGYIETLSKSFEDYLPDQYALVKNRRETTLKTAEGTYLVYIVSGDNDAVLSAIKSGLTE